MSTLWTQLHPRRLVRPVSIGVQFFCLVHLLNSHFLEITPSTGSSMLPTLAMDGDFVLHLRLPFARTLDRVRHRLGSTSLPGEQQNQINKDQSLGTGLKVGDLVVSVSPTHPRLLVCKRVLGLPGDTVLVDPRFPNQIQDQDQDQSQNQIQDFNLNLNPSFINPSTSRNHNHHGEINPITISDFIDSSHSSHDNPSQKHRQRQRQGEKREEIKTLTIPTGHVFLCGDNLANSTDSRHYGPVPLGLIRGKVVARVFPNPSWLSNNAIPIDT